MAEGGYVDVKCRVNGVLDKLKDCSEELHEIERMMTDSRDGSSEEQPDLLSTVRKMLGALETGLKRVPEYEKGKEESSRSKWVRSRRSADPGICTHTCVHHPEIVNPGLWSKLTEDLVGVVFARLPIPRIIELRKSSEAWAAMSDSACFRGAFAEANPKLFGLLGWDSTGENFLTRIVDAAFKEWHGIVLDIPEDFAIMKRVHACDGGLVCFVEELHEDDGCFDCIFVCNPLTNARRKLPDIWETLGYREAVMVQLVTNEHFYRVIVVYSEKLKSEDAEALRAFVYDSRAGSWSVMTSGLVYGTCFSRLSEEDGPHIFDCATKQLIDLESFAAVQDLNAIRSSIVKDRFFVMHAPIIPYPPNGITLRFFISEFTWENNRSDLRKLNDHVVALEAPVGRLKLEIFTSTGFILVIDQAENGRACQLIRIYDVSAGRWRDLPPLIGDPEDRTRTLNGLFICELRWDADP